MTPKTIFYIKSLKQNNGFSIIELLVVIAIIFMLAGLSVGTYGKIKQEAHRSACMANLKTLSYSFSMYINDYNGMMITYKTASGKRWTNLLVENEYLHEGTYFEPAQLTEGNARDVGQEPLHCSQDNSDMDVFFKTKYSNGGSYAINRDITSSSVANIKWSHIQKSSQKILLCDYNQQGVASDSNFAVSALSNSNNWSTGGSDNNGTIGFPHFGGANCLFADWHVESKSKADFKTEDFSLEMAFH